MPINNSLTPSGQNALGAAFGYYPMIQRQGVRARALAQQNDVNTLPDPRTYAAAMGLTGTRPDEMGFSVMHPDLAGIQEVANPAFAAGTALGIAPLLQALQQSQLARRALMSGGRMVGEELGARMLSGQSTIPGLPSSIAPSPVNFAVPPSGRSGFGAFDPRYDPRVLEQGRLREMTRDIQLNPNVVTPSTVSLDQFVGRPFITSMADRTAAGGNLVGIDKVQFNRPVELMGGQDYMFNNPGQVWASAQGPVKQLMKQAAEIKQATGQDPLYMPWRMAPTGGDFAAMTGETMLAYADSAMGKMQKKSLDRAIKKMIPDWPGVSDPKSVEQFRNASDSTRKAVKQMMDRDFRDVNGLNIGGARLAVSDPAQLAAQEGGVMNVGEIFASRPMVMQSGHPSYPRGVPGQGLGTLAEDRNIFELLPEVAKARGIPDPTNPRATDLRALQMKPYAGVITNELLKRLGY